MNIPLNDPFPSVTKADWIAQVAKDLKDPNAYDTLHWHTPEGFTAEPFYTTDDLNELPLAEIQAAQKAAPGWLNAPAYEVVDGSEGDYRDALRAGADALVLRSAVFQNRAGVDLAVEDNRVTARLLNGIKLSETPVFFQTNQPAADFVLDLKRVIPYQLQGGLLTAPDDTTAEATHLTMDSPRFRTVCVSGHDFHNAGATATQELAFTMSRLVDTYDQLTEQGLTVEQLAPKTIFSLSVGTSYFIEIAKLRALRVLVAKLLRAYSPTVPCVPLAVHCTTSTFYESTATPYTNMLRATTEAMSAVVGGCDVLTVRPYDALFAEPSEFSHRIARNVSLLLKYESYFDKVADPSAGSFYIETLTHQLVQSAWALFLDVEKQGGLTKATDFVQAELDRSYAAKVEAVRNGKVLVGVNKFRFDEGGHVGSAKPNEVAGRRLAEEFE